MLVAVIKMKQCGAAENINNIQEGWKANGMARIPWDKVEFQPAKIRVPKSSNAVN